VVPSEESRQNAAAEDCGRTIAFVASMPPRVCMNEILISPTHNRGFIQTPHNQGLTVISRRRSIVAESVIAHARASKPPALRHGGAASAQRYLD
jgi:hypothetical protein